ncbi:MAG: hypothetical protein F6K19_50720 [Cyanothece sp. SIO1E1]|nr:hypothetical protein [Cyanothece sp. SIO1E1]
MAFALTGCRLSLQLNQGSSEFRCSSGC